MNRPKSKTIAVLSLILIITIIAGIIISGLDDGEGSGNIRDTIVCVAVLLISLILFITEIIPAAITAILVPVLLSMPGIGVLTGKEAFKNFGEQWTVTFLGMFIIGYAIMKTGFASKLGGIIIKLSKGKPKRTMLLLCLVLGAISAFISNAACMALFAPIIVAIAYRVNSKPSRMLMPAAFAIILGGNMTLMGASSKGIINGVMETYGMEPFNFFSYLPVGGIMLIAGLLYIALIGDRSIPLRDAAKVEEISDEGLSKKAPYATIAFLFAVVTISTEIISPATASMAGVCIVIISGCITLKEAFRAVSWSSMFIFAGMLALADALQQSGADVIIAEIIENNISSPFHLYIITYFACMLLTSFMSNTATAAVILPIAITAATRMGIDPLPICMGVGISASLDFITPIGNATCTLAYEMGGYKFMDFIKVGLPVQLICGFIGAAATPFFYPF